MDRDAALLALACAALSGLAARAHDAAMTPEKMAKQAGQLARAALADLEPDLREPPPAQRKR